MSRRAPAGAPWRDRIIYFILIDRFYNGDRSNDDFGQGEYDPKSGDCFHGGDLKGIAAKLPYIKKMGFDALWITPPVHNQWINPTTPCRGYHGYWAYDFTQVDPHFGSLDDYKTLVREAHRLGILVIQDIVVNHTGNYFTVESKGYDPRRPEKNWKLLDGSPQAPNDPVFGMNDPNVAAHKAAAVYNFTPNITDYKDREQTLTGTLSDLDDINVRSPLAADRLKEIYRYWIKEVGIDGFRVDTVYYTPEDFYEGFLYDRDPRNLGVKRYARQQGIKDFFVFGEAWSYDYQAINKYLGDERTRRLDSAIDLPLNEALVQIFYRKGPTEKLREALAAPRHNRPLWVNFLDNHDIERMCGRADRESVQQSLAALFTLPGIPCIYYGTENGFNEPRPDMFDEKYYRGKGPHYAFLKSLIALRKKNPLFSRGTAKVLKTSDQSGVLSYEVRHGEERALAVFNTSRHRLHYELPQRTGAWKTLFGSRLGGGAATGSFIIEPQAFHILKESPAKRSAPRRSRTHEVRLKLRSSGQEPSQGFVRLRFDVDRPKAVSKLHLLVDSNFDKKVMVAPRPRGTIELDTLGLRNGPHRLALLARTQGRGLVVSREVPLLIDNPPRILTEKVIAERDRHGIHADVLPPADPSYQGQLDMEHVTAATVGPDLEISVRMKTITTEWNPPHGYDHAYFNVFLSLPGGRGREFLPKLGWCPAGFRFDYGFLFYGWGVVSYAAKDSTPDSYGAPLAAKIEQEADAASRTIRFKFPGELFGGVKDHSGLRIFISTWDGYLGKFHDILPQRHDWAFSVQGGAPLEKVPKIYSHILLDVLERPS